MASAKEKLLLARSRLVVHYPFWGVLALRLHLHEAPWCETAATDGETIYYNQTFIDGLTLPETVGVLAHEVGHCAFGHTWRGEGRQHNRWNIATDYVLNGSLKKAGLTLPKDFLLDPAFDNMSAEEAYAKLPPEPPGGQGKQGKQGGQSGNGRPGQGQGKDNSQQGNGQGQNGSDPGRCGSVIPAKGKNKAQRDEMKAAWKAAVAQAAREANGQGTLPAGLDIELERVTDPQQPWHVLLRDFVELTAKTDYNWRRPNPRYLGRQVVLPGMISEELPEVILADDTSGSTLGYQAQFAAEFSGVLMAYNTTIRVLYCDAEVCHEEVFTREDMPLELKPKGGGGTDFRPIFDYIDKKGYTPACLIFFTDLYGTFPDKAPEYPVMWITPTKGQEGPWGTTVHYTQEEYAQ